MILPRPAHLVAEAGEFVIGPQVPLAAGPGTERAAAVLARTLGPARSRTEAGCGAVRLEIEVASARPPQSYELVIRPDGVRLTAPDEAGLFNGVQSLRQLLRPAAEAEPGAPDDNWRLPCLTVRDEPSVQWRGVLLDVARRFLPLEYLFEFVDLLALHKLNVMQLHLTDDQGWRIEIDGLPELTEVGAMRTESMLGPAGCGRFDGTPHGGFYTQDELRSLVAHAADRGVTIVPEIGVPGHVQALLAAYPELGNDPDRRLPVWTEWGISEHILGVHDEVFEVLETILDQVLEVFPSPFVHIGGDECPTVEWEASPQGRAKARELGLASPALLYGWFLSRVQKILAERGRRAISWAEAELHGDLDPGLVLMAWLDPAHGARAVGRGHQVLMSPHKTTYFDYPQSDDPAEPQGNPEEVVTLADVYGFDPLEGALSAVDLRDSDAGVLGAQAALWTEHVQSVEHARYLLLPRLCAFAEAAWSSEVRDSADFERRLGSHLSRLQDAGMTARTPIAAGHGGTAAA
ncbi:beta-N-acetylhexosaminidase [Actinospica robiniae]|uniref:beta-N-acetylhexosaminidase n=1 Tax=Actinospica robiniae TaxID=304901 RepID=UPI00041F2C34|nr:beta-N-acetylhexosaminidase [Actinospica robiniae]